MFLVLSYSENEMGWALFWDLDPLLQYLHLDKYLLQQYIQSNYEGLKISLCICILGKLCFPGGSDGKASAYNAGDRGSISGSERSPGEGNGNPLQYSCLEKSHGLISLVGYSPWSRRESDTTKWLHFLWRKRHQKTKNLIATSQVSGVKAGYWAWFLHTAPPRGWGQYINHSSQLLDGSNPTLIQFKGPAYSSPQHTPAPLREWARKHVTCFSSSVLHYKSQLCLAWISVGHRTNFYWF